MPRALALPCKQPGCPKLGCKEHTGRQPDSRPNANQRGYDATWQRLRKMYLRANPLCVDCLKEGRVTAAIDVHHIVAKVNGGTNDWNNLQSLCHSHHSKITRKENKK